MPLLVQYFHTHGFGITSRNVALRWVGLNLGAGVGGLCPALAVSVGGCGCAGLLVCWAVAVSGKLH